MLGGGEIVVEFGEEHSDVDIHFHESCRYLIVRNLGVHFLSSFFFSLLFLVFLIFFWFMLVFSFRIQLADLL